MSVLVRFHVVGARNTKPISPITVLVQGTIIKPDSVARVSLPGWLTTCNWSYKYPGTLKCRIQYIVRTSDFSALVANVSQSNLSCKSYTEHLESASKINRAAAFCTTCSLFNWYWDATVYTVLPRSKGGRIRALYNILAVSRLNSQRVLYSIPSLFELFSTI